MNNTEYLFNPEYKLFTSLKPKNTFKIDYSNGYPVQVTTSVNKNTSWKDILSGNYDVANPDGTSGYLLVNGEKYTYIDYKYATEVKHIRFSRYDSPIIKLKVEKYKPTSERIFNKIYNKIFN